jgi:hypothetical protein
LAFFFTGSAKADDDAAAAAPAAPAGSPDIDVAPGTSHVSGYRDAMLSRLGGAPGSDGGPGCMRKNSWTDGIFGIATDDDDDDDAKGFGVAAAFGANAMAAMVADS